LFENNQVLSISVHTAVRIIVTRKPNRKSENSIFRLIRTLMSAPGNGALTVFSQPPDYTHLLLRHTLNITNNMPTYYYRRC